MKNSFVKFSSFVSATVLLMIFCAGSPLYAEHVQDSVPVTALMDQPYDRHEKQKFDIYLPVERSVESTPVLFLIHGGGFSIGDKSTCKGMIKLLQTAFPYMAYVAVGYRLVDSKAKTNHFPAQEEDVKACIEYVLNNRTEYGISEKFAVFGASAGAQLALLYAYKYGTGSYKPAAVISLVGSSNMSKIGEQVMANGYPGKETFYQLFIDVVGGTVEEKPELYYTSSPINYVTADSPPTLMLNAENDEIVPRQQSDELDDKLTAYGVEHTYRLYAGQTHNMRDVKNEFNEEIITFLKKYLK